MQHSASCSNDPHETPLVLVVDDNPTDRLLLGAIAFVGKPINWSHLGHHARYVIRPNRSFEELRESEARLANAQRIAGLGNRETSCSTEVG